MSTPTPSQPPPPPPPGTPPLRCPRCDSTNTKFCYYNNYSLSQPRHFCKTCRRYWTKGGSLRNIPIGGASRKTKKLSRSSKDLKLFHSPTPNFSLPLPTAAQTMSSSIESLSAHNLELHWKLQQQRMSLLYTPPATTLSAPPPPPPPPHVFFQNMEAISNPDTHHDQESAGAAEWFFDNSNYGAHLKNKDVNHGNPTSSNFNNNNDAHGWPAADDDLHFHQFNGLV